MIDIQLIDKYISSKKYAWAGSTISSERRRLIPLSPHLDGVPERLWEALRMMSSYSRLTAWIRVCDFWDFAVPGSSNPYREWKKKNARLFKHAYKRHVPLISYEEAETRIQTISDNEVRVKAMELLRNGFRYKESFNRDGKEVIGKGGKRRPVFTDGEQAEYKRSYSTFLRHLRAAGLKPHDLRKLAATKFYEKGMSEVDLCYVMGWESFETAKSYIRPKTDERLKQIINQE